MIKTLPPSTTHGILTLTDTYHLYRCPHFRTKCRNCFSA